MVSSFRKNKCQGGRRRHAWTARNKGAAMHHAENAPKSPALMDWGQGGLIHTKSGIHTYPRPIHKALKIQAQFPRCGRPVLVGRPHLNLQLP